MTAKQEVISFLYWKCQEALEHGVTDEVAAELQARMAALEDEWNLGLEEDKQHPPPPPPPWW